MLKVKKAIASLFFKSEFEKNLDIILCGDTTDTPNEKNVSNILQSGDSETSYTDAFQSILAKTQEISSWKNFLKIMFVFHKAIERNSSNFLDVFVSEKIKILAGFKTKSEELKDIIHAQIIPSYYCYLLLLGTDFELYTLTLEPLEQNLYFQDKMQSEKFTIIEKICKLLKYNLKITPHLEFSILKYENLEIVNAITALIMTEAVNFYEFFSDYISRTKNDIFYMKNQDALRFYSLYENIIKLTKPTKDFCKLKNLIHQNIKTPRYFVLIPEENKSIELYIQTVRNQEKHDVYGLKHSKDETLATMESNEVINNHFQKVSSDRQISSDRKLVSKSLTFNRFNTPPISDRYATEHKKQYTLINADSSIIEFSDEKKNGSVEHQLFDIGTEESKSDV